MASKPSRHKSTCSEWSQWISNCESSPVFCEKIDNVFFFCQIPKSESIWCLILNSDFCVVVVAVEQKRKENWFYAFLLCSEQPIYLSCIVLSLLRLICVPFMMKHTEKKKCFEETRCAQNVWYTFDSDVEFICFVFVLFSIAIRCQWNRDSWNEMNWILSKCDWYCSMGAWYLFCHTSKSADIGCLSQMCAWSHSSFSLYILLHILFLCSIFSFLLFRNVC